MQSTVPLEALFVSGDLTQQDVDDNMVLMDDLGMQQVSEYDIGLPKKNELRLLKVT